MSFGGKSGAVVGDTAAVPKQHEAEVSLAEMTTSYTYDQHRGLALNKWKQGEGYHSGEVYTDTNPSALVARAQHAPDAQLIAAAPDLLDQARNAHALVKLLRTQGPSAVSFINLDGALFGLDAAIAKALGEPS